MRRAIASILTAAALVGGCASAPLQGYAWSRQDADGVAVLALAADDDALPALVTFACQPGSGAIDLTLTGLRRDGAVIELHVGKVWNRYRGAGLAADGPDAPLQILARLNAADPVLTALADTGELTIVQGALRHRAPNAFAPAHDLLGLCRAS